MMSGLKETTTPDELKSMLTEYGEEGSGKKEFCEEILLGEFAIN